MNDDWSEDLMAKLRYWWSHETQPSAAEIGRQLGKSKNAVVGKAHRLDLPARPSPIRVRQADGSVAPNPHYARQRVPVPKAATLPPLKSLAAPPVLFAATVTVAKPAAPAARMVKRECCWPTSNGRPWTFCEAVFESENLRDCYCEMHRLKARGNGTPSERTAAA
jgi:GcrA cell cycle regulator